MQDRLVDHFIAINCIISVWPRCESPDAAVRMRICLTLASRRRIHSPSQQTVYSFHWILRVGFCVWFFWFFLANVPRGHVFSAVFMAICERASRSEITNSAPAKEKPTFESFFFSPSSLDSILLLCFPLDAKMQSKNNNSNSGPDGAAEDARENWMLTLCGVWTMSRKQEENSDSLNDCVWNMSSSSHWQTAFLSRVAASHSKCAKSALSHSIGRPLAFVHNYNELGLIISWSGAAANKHKEKCCRHNRRTARNSRRTQSDSIRIQDWATCLRVLFSRVVWIALYSDFLSYANRRRVFEIFFGGNSANRCTNRDISGNWKHTDTRIQ